MLFPRLLKLKKSKRTGEEKEFKMPEVCPVCGAPAIREEGEAAVRCTGIECQQSYSAIWCTLSQGKP